jgi:hypothetical protein
MNRHGVGVAIATLLAIAFAPVKASAAPPTVTPSPGYDARLEEQRKANSTARVVAPVAPSPHSPRKHRTERTTTH